MRILLFLSWLKDPALLRDAKFHCGPVISATGQYRETLQSDPCAHTNTLLYTLILNTH
jgi:hypothetical protein